MEKNNEIISGLKSKGVDISDTDFTIAEVISSFADKTAIKVRKDYDGYVVDEVVGFVRSPQVESLISAFPAATLYLFNTEGYSEQMVESYMRGGYVHKIIRYLDDQPYKKRMLYDSLDEFRQEQDAYGRGYDNKLASPKFKSLPSDQVRDELTEYSARELRSIEQYNQFVDTYGKGVRIR